MIPFNWRIQPWIPDEFKGREEERLEQCMQIVILGLWTSRRTSVLINRLPYNDSSREQHNNEIYAGEIYGVITAREKREKGGGGGEGKNGWHVSRLDEELRCLFARFSTPRIFTFCCLPCCCSCCSRDFSFQPWDKRLIRSPRCFHAHEKSIFFLPLAGGHRSAYLSSI